MLSTAIAPVTFTATAEPLVISAVTKVDGDNQTGFAGNFATEKPTVAVLNQFGQPTEGVPVTFSVSGGTITPGATTTGDERAAQLAGWRYGGAGPAVGDGDGGRGGAGGLHGHGEAVPISDYRINVSPSGRDLGDAAKRCRSRRCSPGRDAVADTSSSAAFPPIVLTGAT